MWKITNPVYEKFTTAEVSETEAKAQANAWEKYRNKSHLFLQKPSGVFEEYTPQLFVQAVFNKTDETEFVFPNISDWNTGNSTEVRRNVEFATSIAYRGEVFWRDGLLMKINSKGEFINIATYYITLERKVQEIGPHGSVDKYEVIITNASQELSYLIDVKNYYKLGSLLAAEYPELFVFPGHDEDFKTYSWIRVKEFCANAHTRSYKIFNLLGWYDSGRTLQFMHAGLKTSAFEVKGTLKLVPDRQKGAAFYNSFSMVAPPQVALMLLLYALYAYMAGMYQRCCADEGCRSVMYLAGMTGSGKTSLVKVLTAWLKKAGLSVELRFDDTLASLQENLVNNRDVLTLVDDFYPKAAKSAKTDFQQKAEEITRIIGDGLIKGKMGANRKLMGDRVYRGGIIATGEYVDLGTHSSYLRCFILNISKGDVNFDRLSVLQQSPELAQAFFSEWIYWLEKTQQILFEKMPVWQRVNLNTVRDSLQSEYVRLSVSIATLMTTADCFSEFAQALGITFDVNLAKEIVLMQAQQMSAIAKVMAPEQVAMAAIIEAIENGNLKILPSKEGFKKNPTADGYCEGGHKYWIITTKVRDIIKRYSESNNYSVEFTPTLRETLSNKGFMASPVETKFSQTIPGRTNRPRGYMFNIKEENKNDSN